ncbi:MAG: UDP-3-O-acyl-N-acetylglucosamine deacetylase [Desulforegulaceae bacterium]|nr:UDP-3-O-acyl-N-acetylglucosamine deacetylase [Desulforegulaceae bacterium]
MPQNKNIKIYQHTVNKEIKFYGKGVHSGKDVTLFIQPGEPNSGIQFFRTDLPGHTGIKAIFKNVTDTSLATVIGNGEIIISTIEHLMAAFSAIGVDNAKVLIDNYELPIMDGSSYVFANKILNSGLEQQPFPRHYLVIKNTVELKEEGKFVGAYPDNSYKITCKIDFTNPVVGVQEFTAEITPENFLKKISKARTFGFMSDVQTMNMLGLGRGGSLDTAVVVDGNKILNPEGLRYPDEFVRHKMLDCVGDFSLIGMPLLGHIKTFKSGHEFHRRFLDLLFSKKDCWETKTFV